MAVPTVYRWDDVNAPIIDDNRDWTQIKAWFKTIFVDGYLDNDGLTMKPPLGWAFSEDEHVIDTNINTITLDMIGDPVTENLMRIEFQQSHPDTGYKGLGMNVYEHQSVNPIHNPPSLSQNTFIHGSNDAVGKIMPWVVIGTNRGVYFLSGYNSTIASPNKSSFCTVTNNVAFNYIGNYINDGVNIGKNNQCWRGSTNSTAIYPPSGQASNQEYLVGGNATHGFVHTKRDYQNNFNKRHLVTYERLLSRTGVDYVGKYAIGLKYPYLDGSLFMKEYGLYDTTDGVYFGKMPALYYPEHDRPKQTTNNLIEFDGAGDYAGHKFIGLSGYFNEFYINTTADWGI